MKESIIYEKKDFYRIISLKEFRRTPGVEFHVLEKSNMPEVDSLDRVIHRSDAVSPGPVGDVVRPWYMHPQQDDNLIVMSGKRYVDIYNPHTKEKLSFTITPDKILQGEKVIYEGPAILSWYHGIFHRIISGTNGSASLNIATHYQGFDINTNFNIFSLNTETAEYNVIRRGFLDQE